MKACKFTKYRNYCSPESPHYQLRRKQVCKSFQIQSYQDDSTENLINKNVGVSNRKCTNFINLFYGRNFVSLIFKKVHTFTYILVSLIDSTNYFNKLSS